MSTLKSLEKFDAISNKMNKITKELTKSVELSEEMLVSTEEIGGILESINPDEVIQDLQVLDQESEDFDIVGITNTIINVNSMRQDFEYMREQLKITTGNTRKILESVTEELMYAEGESRAGLIMAFSDLNKAQIEGTKLFMQSYKEVSQILLNLSKVYKESKPAVTNYTTNVVNMESGGFSTSDIINRLRSSE